MLKGLNPVWHDTMVFKVHAPELAFLIFTVFVKNLTIAHYALPYRCIQQGYFTCNVHLRLTGKLAVDILFVLIELFSLGVMAEALQANFYWKSAFLKRIGQLRPFFHVEGDVAFLRFGLRGNI